MSPPLGSLLHIPGLVLLVPPGTLARQPKPLCSLGRTHARLSSQPASLQSQEPGLTDLCIPKVQCTTAPHGSSYWAQRLTCPFSGLLPFPWRKFQASRGLPTAHSAPSHFFMLF